MTARKWAVGSFVPCSPRHHHCSPAHADFVARYRDERARQEAQLELELGMFNRDQALKLWKENGGHLVDLKDWMIAHKGKANEQESWQNSSASDARRGRGKIAEDTPVATARKIKRKPSAFADALNARTTSIPTVRSNASRPSVVKLLSGDSPVDTSGSARVGRLLGGRRRDNQEHDHGGQG